MPETPRLLPETPDLFDALIEALKSLTGSPLAPHTTRGPKMDVLSDVLRVVRLSRAVLFTADFSSPWALESPAPDALASAVMPEAECVVLFHTLVDGECEAAGAVVQARREDGGERRRRGGGVTARFGTRSGCARRDPAGHLGSGGQRDRDAMHESNARSGRLGHREGGRLLAIGDALQRHQCALRMTPDHLVHGLRRNGIGHRVRGFRRRPQRPSSSGTANDALAQVPREHRHILSFA